MASKDNFNGVITLVAPTGGVTAGTMVYIQAVACLPLETVSAGASFAALVCGRVKDAPKTTSQVWTAGQKLYWVAGTAKFSSASTGGTDVGARVAAAAISAAAVGDVLIGNQV
jgi:predicted RecA/RadA family phage recombinase